VDFNALFDFLNKTGLFGGAIYVIWLLYTERLIPSKRLEEQKEATKAALEATKELSVAIKELSNTVGEVRVTIAGLTMLRQIDPPPPPKRRRQVGGS
jgi:hypothetical protein